MCKSLHAPDAGWRGSRKVTRAHRLSFLSCIGWLAAQNRCHLSNTQAVANNSNRERKIWSIHFKSSTSVRCGVNQRCQEHTSAGSGSVKFKDRSICRHLEKSQFIEWCTAVQKLLQFSLRDQLPFRQAWSCPQFLLRRRSLKTRPVSCLLKPLPSRSRGVFLISQKKSQAPGSKPLAKISAEKFPAEGSASHLAPR
jgi:hypothetical protein